MVEMQINGQAVVYDESKKDGTEALGIDREKLVRACYSEFDSGIEDLGVMAANLAKKDPRYFYALAVAGIGRYAMLHVLEKMQEEIGGKN